MAKTKGSARSDDAANNRGRQKRSPDGNGPDSSIAGRVEQQRLKRILALDPGSVNFAWAFRAEGRLLDAGWLKPLSTVEDDTDFINSFIELITELKPEFVVFERFMVRNRGQSVYAEKINLMLGSIKVLARLYGRCDPIMITAAQWKVFFEKQGKSSESLHPELPSIHQQDAAAIAMYADVYWIDEHFQQRLKAKSQ